MIFPYVEPSVVEETSPDLPLAKEWAWDFTTNDFKLINNKPYLVEGIEAVKIWAYKSLMTDRFKHTYYSWEYGSELNSLIGSGFSHAAVELEAKRLVDEALMSNPYIESVRDFNISFSGDTLSVEFVLDTVYGQTEVNI